MRRSRRARRRLLHSLVLENLAEEYGATLTAEQKAAIEASDQAYIDQYGSEEAFESELNKLGMRRETYDRVSTSNYLYQNLYQLYNTEGSKLYASDEDLALYAAEKNYITADHILLTTKDTTTGEALSDEEKAEKKALAEEIKQKLDACEGDLTALTALFRELADEYSEDPTGFTFTTGAMVPEFEAAAYALAEGAVSEIVESSFGYHILLRLPLDKAAAADAVRETYFTDFFSDRVESAVIATSAEFDKLDPQVLYETIQTDSGTAAVDDVQFFHLTSVK